MDDEDYKAMRGLLHRRLDSNKYYYGHTLVVGGSPGMVGAPFLAAMAAMRVGAGLVTIASVPEVIDKLEKRIVEIMTLRLPENKSLQTLTDYIGKRKVNSLVLGPGLDEGAKDLVRSLVAQIQLPTVLDAGGLAAFNGDLDTLKKHPGLVLTPHTGEFAKLINQSLSDWAKSEKLAKEVVSENNLTIVLKGNHTLVAASGRQYINQTGNPGLATAGTGDVLTGVIAGLLAQGLDTFSAAKYGVYLHGLAGDLAAAAKTEPGMIASDVIEFMPKALKFVVRSSRPT